jgi:hypothetical protein
VASSDVTGEPDTGNRPGALDADIGQVPERLRGGGRSRVAVGPFGCEERFAEPKGLAEVSGQAVGSLCRIDHYLL